MAGQALTQRLRLHRPPAGRVVRWGPRCHLCPCQGTAVHAGRVRRYRVFPHRDPCAIVIFLHACGRFMPRTRGVDTPRETRKDRRCQTIRFFPPTLQPNGTVSSGCAAMSSGGGHSGRVLRANRSGHRSVQYERVTIRAVDPEPLRPHRGVFPYVSQAFSAPGLPLPLMRQEVLRGEARWRADRLGR